MLGNAMADWLAEKGARMCQVSDLVASEVFSQFSMVTKVQHRLVDLLIPVLAQRHDVCKVTIGWNLPLMGARLASAHDLVSPFIPFCLKCGWGPKGVEKIRWMKAACVGCTKAKLSKGKLSHIVPTFVDGVVQVAGHAIHPSHTLVVFRGLFMCVHCGYSAGEYVVKLGELCCCQLSATRKNSLKKLCRGELPYSRTQWPAEPPPPPPLELLLT